MSRPGEREPGIDPLTDDWRPSAARARVRRPPDHQPFGRLLRKGHIYTNTIEGFFGNLKTGMRGAYKGVSRKWLQSYLDEYAWRHNHRLTDQRSLFHALVREAAKQ